MDSGDGGNDSESGGYHHEQQPFKQSKKDYHNHHPIGSKIISRGIMYFIAFASVCFVLYITFGPNQFYLPISNNRLSRQAQDSTNSIHCSLPAEIVKFFASLSNHSSSLHALTDELLQGNPSPVSNNSTPEALPVNHETQEAKLGKMLSEAAMESKTVIVTTVNAAWAAPNSLLDLFLGSFKIGIETQKFLKHLVVVALDQKAYSRCLDLHSHCFALTTEGVDFSADQAGFMTDIYVKLVWRKIEVMYTVLQMGYNAIFTVCYFAFIFMIALNRLIIFARY